MTYPAETRDRAMAAYVEGVPVCDIRVNKHTLYYWLRLFGIPRHNAYGPRLQPAELRRLHAEGLSDRQIGRAMGVSDKTVQRYRARNGIPANFYAPSDFSYGRKS